MTYENSFSLQFVSASTLSVQCNIVPLGRHGCHHQHLLVEQTKIHQF